MLLLAWFFITVGSCCLYVQCLTKVYSLTHLRQLSKCYHFHIGLKVSPSKHEVTKDHPKTNRLSHLHNSMYVNVKSVYALSGVKNIQCAIYWPQRYTLFCFHCFRHAVVVRDQLFVYVFVFTSVSYKWSGGFLDVFACIQTNMAPNVISIALMNLFISMVTIIASWQKFINLTVCQI